MGTQAGYGVLGVVVVVCAEDEAKPMQAMVGLFRGMHGRERARGADGLGVCVVTVWGGSFGRRVMVVACRRIQTRVRQ